MGIHDVAPSGRLILMIAITVFCLFQVDSKFRFSRRLLFV